MYKSFNFKVSHGAIHLLFVLLVVLAVGSFVVFHIQHIEFSCTLCPTNSIFIFFIIIIMMIIVIIICEEHE